jgi:hypothetical protein
MMVDEPPDDGTGGGEVRVKDPEVVGTDEIGGTDSSLLVERGLLSDVELPTADDSAELGTPVEA